MESLISFLIETSIPPQQPSMFISNKSQYVIHFFLISLRARSQNSSILVVLTYSWQVSANMKKFQSLGDVYYGEQMELFAFSIFEFHFNPLKIDCIPSLQEYKLLTMQSYSPNSSWWCWACCWELEFIQWVSQSNLCVFFVFSNNNLSPILN